MAAGGERRQVGASSEVVAVVLRVCACVGVCESTGIFGATRAGEGKTGGD